MIKALKSQESDDSWLPLFCQDFKSRFLSLISFEFKVLPVSLCLSIVNPNLTTNESEDTNVMEKQDWQNFVSLYDLKRMEAYTKNMVDYHLILDLLPTVARFFFLKKFKSTLRFFNYQSNIFLLFISQYKSYI